MQQATRLSLIGFVTVFFGVTLSGQAQESISGRPVICYSSSATHLAHRAPVRAGLRLQQQTARIDVTYADFPPETMAAFQRALDTWATLITSSVPIHIHAIWAALPSGALATTSATKLYRGFAGAVQPDIWYPVTLAEKLTGRDLNGTGQADITITINKDKNWYVGLDGNTPANKIDFLSVVLHEVAHGLGFTSAADAKDSTGSLRDDGYLLIYDLLLQTKSGVRPSAYADPSPALLNQLTSDNLYLQSPTAAVADQNRFPKVFAPAFYNRGGSISHLDEATYPPGDPNALMTPYFANGESVHETGGILMGVLADLGWNAVVVSTGEAMVFPNPGTGLVMIRAILNSGTVNLRVCDLIGNVIGVTNAVVVNGALIQLDLSGLASGFYMLTITTPTGEWQRKLILSK